MSGSAPETWSARREKEQTTRMLTRQECAATVLGGPTTVLDLGGLRIVVDPTFDDPSPHGYLTKTAAPVCQEEALGPIDVVLVSHAAHPDNLDDRGRAFALAAPLVLTCPSAAAELGPRAIGLQPWTSHAVGGDVTITAVPAVHGPEDAPRDENGNVNCEVTGFLVAGPDLPTVYVSGDNASVRVVVEVAERFPHIDAAVLFAGAARLREKFGGRPLTLDAARAAAAAAILDTPIVVPAHYDGWAHFSETGADIAEAFEQAGYSSVLRLADHGTWIRLDGSSR
jgi:L-ascorbate metabolism protein UlaG (beta-lactamase superfamily)